MRVVGRAFLFPFGLLLAIPAGLVALTIGVAFEPAAQELIAALGIASIEELFSGLLDEEPFEGVSGALFVRIWLVSATLLILPPALVALIGEIGGIRSFVWYGLGCGALTAALPWLARGGGRMAERGALGAEGRITALLFVAGAAAGLTYWLVAGRSAGARRPINAPAS